MIWEVRIDPFSGAVSQARSEFLDRCDRRAGVEDLPNDLTRMLYLSSLRDCNSGRYLHPQLSPGMGTEEAHRALSACHERVFLRMLMTPVAQYVVQLEEYIRYTRTERSVMLATWESLEAYRATVPVHAMPVYRDLFCLNVEMALAVLKQEAASSGNSISHAVRGWS